MCEILGHVDVNNYGLQSMVAGGEADLQEKTATPTTSQQVIQADEGYDGLSSVTVNAVTSAIDENIIPTNIRTGKTILGVQGNLEPDKPDQNKTVIPSTVQQVVVADTGYELASVTVEAMNLQSKDVSISTNGTTTIEADQGYDGLSDVDVTVSGILDTSDATATEEDIVNPKTAYVNGVKLSGQLRKSGSLTFTDLEGIAIISNRFNLSGLTTRTTLLDANRYVFFRPLLSDVAPVIGAEASKIKKDEVICGVTGTYTSDATATAGDIASGKTAYVNGVKLTGTMEEPSPDWSEIGYSDVPQALLDDFDYSKSIADNWDSSKTSLTSKFAYNSTLKYMPLVNTSNATKMSSMFKGCSNLTTIPQLDTSNVTSMSETFSGCIKLTSVPLLDTVNVTKMMKIFEGCTMLTSVPLLNTSNVTDMVGAFSGCIKLTSVPLFNTSNVTSLNTTFKDCTMLTSVPLLDTSNVKNMSGMVSNCSSLSNESLNNILAMCTNTTSAYTGTKALSTIGLSQTQAETCQTLSNWDAFVTAGWSTGYET